MFFYRHILILIILYFCTASSYAQGEYLQDGTNGFEIDGNLSGYSYSGNFSLGYGGKIGYSVEGVFDMCLELSRFNDDSSQSTEGAHMTTYFPYIVFHLAKYNHFGHPLGLSFLIGYTKSTYSADDNEIVVTSEPGRFQAGFLLYQNLMKSPDWTFQPNFEILFKKDPGGNSVFKLNSTIKLGIAAYIKMGKNRRRVLKIGPSIGFSGDYTIIEVKAGVLWPFASLR